MCCYGILAGYTIVHGGCKQQTGAGWNTLKRLKSLYISGPLIAWRHNSPHLPACSGGCPSACSRAEPRSTHCDSIDHTGEQACSIPNTRTCSVSRSSYDCTAALLHSSPCICHGGAFLHPWWSASQCQRACQVVTHPHHVGAGYSAPASFTTIEHAEGTPTLSSLTCTMPDTACRVLVHIHPS